ncbi:MAG: YtxH domain-containing protein [Persicimonas sp.]
MNISDLFSKKTQAQRTDQMLDRLGLQRKSDSNATFSKFGLFGLGLAVGVGVGMLFAPSSGREIRSKAINKLPQAGAGRQQMSGQEQIRQTR